MSLSSMLSIANSGLAASQAGLRTVSDNIANVGTTGYVRKIADQTSASAGGIGVGVNIAQLRLAADKFLQAAGLKAAADSGSAAVRGDMVDQAQSLFGDPNAATSFFNSLDSVFSSFTALSATPSATARSAAVGQVSSFLDQAGAISSGLSDLQGQADGRIADDVDTANNLLKRIDALNAEISRASVGGGDSTGAQETQSQLIDQLSTLMQVQVTGRSQGGVTLRSADGVALAGDGAATLSYQQTPTGGRLSATTPAGSTVPLNAGSGEIAGLIKSRNVDLPAMASQLGELTFGVVGQLNAAHNASSAVPAPTTLTGRDTAIPLATSISGFSGKTTVGVTDGSGALVQAVAIDFSAGTMTVGSTTTSFTAASFLTSLNTALSPAASASFVNGALSLSAASSANGVAISDDAATPATSAGKGFSAFFGLNDLVTARQPSDYATGLQASADNPFAGSGAVTLRLTGADGSGLRDITVAMPPAGSSMADMVNALNDASTGVGLYGSFALDAQGRLAFSSPQGVSLAVPADTTASAASPTTTMSALFGLDPGQRGARAQAFTVRSDIAADPSRLGLAKANLTVATGASALSSGDVSGADALAQAGGARRSFDAAGGVGPTAVSVSAYASRIAAALASRAADADGSATAAASVQIDTAARRSAKEGVNLDQELISLTSYQQSYNASARLIQAAKDLYDTLLQMV